MPLKDSIYLKILWLLRLKLAKIYKGRVLLRSGEWEKFPQINKRVGRLLGIEEYCVKDNHQLYQ